MRLVKIIIVVGFFLFSVETISEAGWLIYHKPAFQGKVIDAETKKPIEGAVIVAVYNKTTVGLGAGNISSIISVRETLTDKDGTFLIPSYTTIIQPFSWEDSASFIIFKPGYGNFPDKRVYPPGLSLPDQEKFFSMGVGAELYMETQVGLEFKVATLKTGIVELPKLRTKEERWHASFVGVAGYSEKELPLLYKARSEEDKALGIK